MRTRTNRRRALSSRPTPTSRGTGLRYRSVAPVRVQHDAPDPLEHLEVEEGMDPEESHLLRRLPPRAPALPSGKLKLHRLSTLQRRLSSARHAALRRRGSGSAWRAKLDDLEIFGWWDSETEAFGQLVLRLLASVPGGEEAEDVGYEPFENIGWKEFDMIGKMMEAIQGKDDVSYIVSKLIHGDEEPDDYND